MSETLRVLQYNWSTKTYIYFLFQMSGNKKRFIEEKYNQNGQNTGNIWNPTLSVNVTVKFVNMYNKLC